MTQYELLMKKADDCLLASSRCGPRFVTMWLLKAHDLRSMASSMSVEEASRAV